MTHTLSPDSPRRERARRFGRELGRTMRERGISERRLAEATGIGRSLIRQVRAGYTLPSLKSGSVFAQALDSDHLLQVLTECRTERCALASCGRPFVNPGSPRRYCSDGCQDLAQKKRAGLDIRQRAGVAEGRLAETEAQLASVQAAVDAMCHSCEPEGVCRTPDCPLRPASPLPTVRERAVSIARPAPGPWGSPENRAAALAGIRAGNAERWARPGEREAQSARTAARHARNRANQTENGEQT